MLATHDNPTMEEVEAHWQATRDLMAKIDRHIFRKLGFKVVTGPFNGMIVTDVPIWNDGNAGLKLLGYYEHELWDAVERAIARKPSAVINIGCAEGYYAIGLKRRMPNTPVYAVDMNGKSLEQCAGMARRNGVSVITRIGCKTPQELSFGHLGALYVVDCEGDEVGLLDPLRCTELISADIIVECHDFLRPMSPTLAQRFAPTHDIEIIEAKVPELRDYQKLLDPLPIGTKMLAITEKRPSPTVWLSLMAKERNSHG